MKPLAIVGLDPGTTAAYTVLGLDGRRLGVFSAKELSLSDVISQVMDICQPIIVGTDKARVPSFVEQFATKVGAEVVKPEEDLQKQEKRLLRGSLKLNDDHQRDSYAAAKFAYKKFLPRLRKIDRFVEQHHLQKKRNAFTRLALKEDMHFLSIKDLVLKKNDDVKVLKKVVQEEKITKKDFVRLYEKLSAARKEKILLEQRLGEVRKDLKKTRRQKEALERKPTIAVVRKPRENPNQALKDLRSNFLESQQSIQKLLKFIPKIGSFLLVKKLENLSQNEYKKRNDVLDIKDNDHLLIGKPEIHSAQVIRVLQGRGIKLLGDRIPQFLSNKFQSMAIKEMVEENDYFALVEVDRNCPQQDVVRRVVEEYKDSR